MSQQNKTVRRIVTGHDANGQAVISADGNPERSYMIGGAEGAKFHEIWHTLQSPALVNNGPGDPVESNLVLSPPKGGTRIRVVDFPPEGEAIRNLSAKEGRQHFKTMGGEEASTAEGLGLHPLMHRTETIDYGIVLEGELTLILDHGQTTIKAGDIVIQRGTNHAWANRSGKSCRIAFILVDGQYTHENNNLIFSSAD